MSSLIRWLLVGAGDIARRRVAPALSSVDHSRLVAVCSARRSRAAELAAEFSIDRVHDDFESAIADPSVDAVYLATPVALHVPQALRAMRSGKHVLVEKPLGLNGGEAVAAARQARTSGVIAGCAYYRRCYPSILYAREMLEKGKLGRILLVRTACSSWFCPAVNDAKYWRVQRTVSGGGPLADMGSHMLDLVVALLGMPRSAFAKTATRVQPYEVEDSASFLLTFADGAFGQGSFFWNSQSWSHEFEILGTEGRLHWSPFDSGAVAQTIGRQRTELAFPNAPNVHEPLIADFVQAVREGREPIAPLEEAAKASAILDGIYASAQTGQEIRL
jgi:predicted dehydrogenase